MGMLLTPLGRIAVCVDSKPVEYEAKRVAREKCCEKLDGRFAIHISFVPDGDCHCISCRIVDYTPSEEDGIESGERLELKSFFGGEVKLSMGMEGDTAYWPDGTRASAYDYDTEYLDDGVQYKILPMTRTTEYVFGIAWIKPYREDNELQTWFGADPTMF